MLRKPVPTGVVMGAFSAHLVRLTLSIVLSGSGVPVRAITSTPASCTSQLILTPVASMHLRAASANSGPVPSPVIRVTSCAMVRHSPGAKMPSRVRLTNAARSVNEHEPMIDRAAGKRV